MFFLRFSGSGAILALCIALCYGQDSSTITIIPNGHAAMEFGQVVHGYDKSVGTIDHVVVNRMYFGTGVDVRLGARTDFTGIIEVKAFNEFPRQVINGYTRRFYYYFYLWQAELTHRLIAKNGLHLDIGGGYFPYKYNSEVRNLGEYLFRSTAYPQTLKTEFNYALERLTGLYARSVYSSGITTLKCDLLATINTEWMAIGDLNLSVIASYNLAKVFEIGAGVEFGSLVSADETATTPKNDATKYMDGNDTANYTFRGTKLMGRLSFDPKKLIGNLPVFGDSDLILYTEAALLGTKNYDVALNSPLWYNSPLERVPVMGGFNFPTFKFLNVLSIEGEWWGNRYPNSMQGIVQDGLPLPYLQGTKTIDSIPYLRDNIKWSVFGARSFAKQYRVSFQVASDHLRTFAWDWNRQDWEESLRGPDKWYYMLRFYVHF
jgi:hypothetical protein